jgi:hypothetical protein
MYLPSLHTTMYVRCSWSRLRIKQSGPEPVNKIAKKKVFEKVAPDLKTDGTGQVVWKDVLAKTSAGVVKAHNGMTGAQVA